MTSQREEQDPAVEPMNSEQLMGRAIAEERQRIAFEMHDGLGQILTGIGLNVEALRQLAEQGKPIEAASFDRMTALIQRAFEFTRELARQSAWPSVHGPLSANLQRLAHDAQQIFGIECEVLADGNDSLGGDPRAHALFRIAQESINNAVKHGAATIVVVELRRENGWLLLRIRDNGMGFRGAPPRTGLGIQIMQRRAGAIGARIEITSRDKSGTLVECRTPLCPKTES
jgi:two-component system CheB/CheR fusion protein